jgi:tetratricopeptide (TPR) repeat protein
MFGLERLADLVVAHSGESVEELKTTLVRELTEFRGTVALNDDLTIMIAEVGEPGKTKPEAMAQGATLSVPDSDTDSPVEKAIGLYHEKRYTEAIEGFSALSGANGESQATALLLAESYFSLKKYAEALVQYEKYAADRVGTDFRVLFRMTSCHAHLGQFDKAEAIALRSVATWPENPDAAAQLALMQVKQGKNAEALVHIRKALTYNPESARYRKILELIGPANSPEN